MKKFLMVLAATTMAVSPMMAAQAEAASYRTTERSVYNSNGKRVVTKTQVKKSANRGNSKYQQNRYAQQNRQWAKGQHFDRRYATNYRVINNPRAYHLSNAPRGYQWVRSNNDAVLIAISSGLIAAVLTNTIRG